VPWAGGSCLSWAGSGLNRSTFLRLLAPEAGDRILDVGAGKGNIAAAVQSAAGCEVHALDPDPRRIAEIQRRHPNLKTCLSSSESMPFTDGFFDKVYSTVAAHHFESQDRAFGEMWRVLKQGGILVLGDISPGTLGGRALRFVENLLRDNKLKFLDATEMSRVVKGDGRFVVDAPVFTNPYYFLRAVRREIT
jgi:ubiquinone/menaquinone biosynthesis C-methylase UbiE